MIRVMQEMYRTLSIYSIEVTYLHLQLCIVQRSYIYHMYLCNIDRLALISGKLFRLRFSYCLKFQFRSPSGLITYVEYGEIPMTN